MNMNAQVLAFPLPICGYDAYVKLTCDGTTHNSKQGFRLYFQEPLSQTDTMGKRLLTPANLQIYANVIYGKDAAPANCFEFVDMMVRPVCRPKKHHCIVHNGHKCVHSLKFHSVTLPNGLIANMFAPIDMYVLVVLPNVA